jgi:DNA-binding transcriptional ArsR family regulator
MKVNRVKPLVTARKRSRTALPEDSAKSDRIEAVEAPPETTGSHWTFLTNHLHVLILLSRNPSVVLRNVALQVKITERAVQRIIADLEVGGYIEREKVGRQNHYRIRVDQPLRHAIGSHLKIGDLLALINEDR